MITRRLALRSIVCSMCTLAFVAADTTSARADSGPFTIVGTWRHEAGYASTTMIFRPDGTYSCMNDDRLNKTHVEQHGRFTIGNGVVFLNADSGLKGTLHVFPTRNNLATFRTVISRWRYVDATFGKMN